MYVLVSDHSVRNMIPYRFNFVNCRWGCEHEKDAVHAYQEEMKKHHQNFSVEECGLIINPSFPLIGASPDSIVRCDCHGKGVLEIKCPHCLTSKSMSDKSEDPKFCIQKDPNNVLSLQKDHSYYYQVQAQIHVADVSYSDFVVWSCNEPPHIERILPDTALFDCSFEKITKFIKNCILPEMIGKIFTAPRVTTLPPVIRPASKGIGCYCGEPDDEAMLVCKSGRCTRLSFHKKCLKLDKVAKTWKCMDCNRSINKEKRELKRKKSELS